MQTLDELMTWARTYVMSPEEKEAQRRSFAFGNVRLANPTITRALVDEVANAEGVPKGTQRKP